MNDATLPATHPALTTLTERRDTPFEGGATVTGFVAPHAKDGTIEIWTDLTGTNRVTMRLDQVLHTHSHEDGSITAMVPSGTQLQLVQIRTDTLAARTLEGALLNLIATDVAGAAITKGPICRLVSVLTHAICPTTLWTNCTLTAAF